MAIVANTGSNNWNTNAAWVGAVQPTAADDVTIPATAVVTIPTATTVQCRSYTEAAGGSLAFASTTAVLNIGDGTAGAGNSAFNNSSTGTITLTGIGTINFISTSATQQTITTGGKTMPNLTFNGAGSSYLHSDNVTFTGAILTVSQGTWNANGKTFTGGSYSFSGSSTRTVTLGAAAMTATSTGTSYSTATSTGLTMTANTATITCTGAGAGAAGGTFNQNGLSLVMSGSGAQNINGGTWGPVTRTNTAVKTDSFSIQADFTCTTLTLTVNSTINRLLVTSNTYGTARTITATSLVATNVVDFQDITGAGAATWTTAASGATAFGDGLGNSGITFTPPTIQNVTMATNKNASDVTIYTSRVPLPQDNVTFTGVTGGTLTNDMPRMGSSYDWTGATGSPVWAFTSIPNIIYGSPTLAAGMTTSGTNVTSFPARTGNFTITSAGVTWTQGLTFQTTNDNGHYLLGDNLVTNGVLNLGGGFNGGHLEDQGHNVTFLTFNASFGSNQTGSGTWHITSTAAATVWNVASSGFNIVNMSTATIVIDNASANTRIFAGGNFIYGTLQYTVNGSTGTLQVPNSNYFGKISFKDATNARTIQFTSGQTNVIINRDIVGTSGKLMTVSAITGGSPTTLVSTRKWFIGANSTVGTGNTGITVAAGVDQDFTNYQDVTGVAAVGLASASVG